MLASLNGIPRNGLRLRFSFRPRLFPKMKMRERAAASTSADG
eukprot:COSAG04_NODE_24697_length_318_cov_0.707763_1_plen_41_part_10